MSVDQKEAEMLVKAAAVLGEVNVDMVAVPTKPEPLVDPLLKKIGLWLGGNRFWARIIFFVRGTDVVTVLTEALRREQQRLTALESFEEQMYQNLGQAWRDGGEPDIPGLESIVAKADPEEIAKETAAIGRLDEQHSSLSRMLAKRQESMEAELNRRDEKLQQAVASISVIDNAASQLALEGSLALRQVLEDLPNELKRSLQRASFNEVRDDLDTLKAELNSAVRRMQDGLTRAARDLETLKEESIEEEQQLISMRSELMRRQMTREREISESLGVIGQELGRRANLFYNGKYVAAAIKDGKRLLIETRRRLEGLNKAFAMVNDMTGGLVLNRQVVVGVMIACALGIVYSGGKKAMEMGLFASQEGLGTLNTWELPASVEVYGEFKPAELESFVPLIRTVNEVRSAAAAQPSANMILDSKIVMGDGAVLGFAGYPSERRMVTVGPFADQEEKVREDWEKRGIKIEEREEHGETLLRLDYLRAYRTEDDGRFLQGDPDLLAEILGTRARELVSVESLEGFADYASELTAQGCLWFVMNDTDTNRKVSSLLSPFGLSEMPRSLGVEIYCTDPMRVRLLLHYTAGAGVQAGSEISQALSSGGGEGAVAQVTDAIQNSQIRSEEDLVVVELDLKHSAVPALFAVLF